VTPALAAAAVMDSPVRSLITLSAAPFNLMHL
jgi:hypothetical protein